MSGRWLLALLATAVFAMNVGPAGATITKVTPEFVQSFSNPGPVAVEEDGGLSKYIWFADNISSGGVRIYGYIPGNTAVQTEIYRDYTAPEGEIGEVSSLATANTSTFVFVGDTLNNRVLWYPRVNDTLPADQVVYAQVGQTPGPLGANTPGSGNGEFDGVGGMTPRLAGPTGEQLLVVDRNNLRIQVFNVDSSGLTYSESYTDPDWALNGQIPQDVALDHDTGEILVAMLGGGPNRISTMTADGTPTGGFSPAPGDGYFDQLEYDVNKHVLYASNAASLKVYNPGTGRYLDQYLFTSFGEPVNGPDNGNRMIKFFDVNDGTGVISMARFNPNDPPEPADPLPAQSYVTDNWPLCDLPGTISVSAGQSVDITPTCSDDQGGTIKEFELDGTPSLGSASLNANDAGITYQAPASGSGATTVRFYVTTITGRSQAYEQSISIPAVAVPPPPPAEKPVVRQTTNLELDSGDVFVKVPGSSEFVKLTAGMLVPIGTVIDAREGKALLTLANKDGSLYEGIFWDGIFQVIQGSGDKPVTTMKLRDDLVAKASGFATASSAAELERSLFAYTAKKRGKKKNGLWGDGKGKFKTSGKGGSAAVRGTRWYVANYANGTLFKVSKGSVTIDPIRGKNFTLKAGKSFFIFYKR